MKKHLKIMLCIVLCLAMLNVNGVAKTEAASNVTVFKKSSVKNFHVTKMSGSSISFEWDKLKGATGYSILRDTDKNGKFKLGAGTTENFYEDDTVKHGVTYYYKIYGETSYKGRIYKSKSVTIAVSSLPDKPTVNTIINDNEVKLTIKKVTGADGYKIYMATSKSGEYKTVKTIKAGDSLSYTKSGLQSGNTYYFKVCAYCLLDGKTYQGEYSSIKKVVIDKQSAQIPSTDQTLPESFEYEIKNGKATIVKFLDKTLKKVEIPEKIEGYPVTAIASDAFKTFIQPPSVASDVSLSDDQESTTTKEPFNVKEIIVPDSVTELGNRAFALCVSVEKITLPNNLQTIGSVEDDSDYAGVFRGCVSLKEINIPDKVKVIGVRTFSGCQSLENVGLPDSVESIGDYAFNNCTKLNTITLPKSLKQIGEQAFRECESLKEISIPGTVKKISTYAFEDCTNIKELTLKDGIEEIETGAFDGCDNLTEITIPGSVISINLGVFDFNPEDGPGLEKIIISEGVRRIQIYGEYGEKLKYIYVPKSVTSIESDDDYCYYRNEQYAIVTPKGSYAETWFKDKKIPVVTE